MRAVRAHVQNGQIVLDEPVALTEGVGVEVLVPDHDEMSAEELAALDVAVDESVEQFNRGESEDARAFVLGLLARS